MKTTGSRRIQTWHVFAAILTALMAVAMEAGATRRPDAAKRGAFGRVALGLTVLLVLVCVLPSRAYAAGGTAFEYNKYTASVWTEDDSPSQKAILYACADNHPSHLIVTAAADEGLDTSIAAWKGVHMTTDPSKITSTVLDEKGYCESIIFSVMLADCSDTKLLGSCDEAISDKEGGGLSQGNSR